MKKYHVRWYQNAWYVFEVGNNTPIMGPFEEYGDAFNAIQRETARDIDKVIVGFDKNDIEDTRQRPPRKDPNSPHPDPTCEWDESEEFRDGGYKNSDNA